MHHRQLSWGVGYDEKIAKKIEEVAGVRAVATATAVVEALRHLRVESIAVATPYIDEVNKKEEEFLRDSGFNVVSMIGLGIESNIEIGRQAPEVAYRLGRAADHRDAEALFISCTNFRTFEILEALEMDLGKTCNFQQLSHPLDGVKGAQNFRTHLRIGRAPKLLIFP